MILKILGNIANVATADSQTLGRNHRILCSNQRVGCRQHKIAIRRRAHFLNIRAKHIGTSLYEFVLDFAKKSGCYNLTLNVWACNENALRFYEKRGLKPQKIGMEVIL